MIMDQKKVSLSCSAKNDDRRDQDRQITVRPERRGRARPGRTPVKASPVAPSLPPPRHAWPAPPGAHAGVCRAGAPRAQRAAREAAGQWSSVALFVSRLRGVQVAGHGAGETPAAWFAAFI